MCLDPHLNQGGGGGLTRRDTGLNHLGNMVKYFTDSSRRCFFLWIIYDISVCFFCLLCFHVPLFINALWSPAGKGQTSWLTCVMYNCEGVTFLLVSWVRCGA